MWQQRARVLWLGNGDNNTKYYHSKATHRFRKKSIIGLYDASNRWIDQPDDIAMVLEDFYNQLFSTSQSSSMASVMEHVPSMISHDMNEQLTSEFLESKVVTALKQMAPMIAPGPNGMPPLFYQHFWPLIEGDVTQSVLSWLNSGTLPQLVNHTFITLIPKKKCPEHVSDFRPISLCNVLYKIFSKVLANRLKKFYLPLLPSINLPLPRTGLSQIIS